MHAHRIVILYWKQTAFCMSRTVHRCATALSSLDIQKRIFLYRRSGQLKHEGIILHACVTSKKTCLWADKSFSRVTLNMNRLFVSYGKFSNHVRFHSSVPLFAYKNLYPPSLLSNECCHQNSFSSPQLLIQLLNDTPPPHMRKKKQIHASWRNWKHKYIIKRCSITA